MVNAECSNPTGGVCQCLPDYFRQDKECLALKKPSEPCTATPECVTNANCTHDFGALVCVCNAGFYDAGGRCERRIKPQKPCSGLGQCIENAECTSEEGGLCQCNKG